MRMPSMVFMAVITAIALLNGESAFATGYYRTVFVENTVDPVELQFEGWESYRCSAPWEYGPCRWRPTGNPPHGGNPQGMIRSYTISNQSPTSLTVTFTLDGGSEHHEGPYGPYVYIGGWNFVDPSTGALRHTIQISSDCDTNPCEDLPFNASVIFRSALQDASLSMVPGGTLSEGQLSNNPLRDGANQVLFFSSTESMSAAFKVVPEPNALALVLIGFAAMGVAMRDVTKAR